MSLGVGAPAPASGGTPASGLGSSSSKSDSDKKKKFVPNLSVQRKENAGNSKSIITINKDNNSKPSSGGWKQQQQNSKFEKSRGGGRNFIQSSGLFSEGLGSEQDGKKKTWGRAPSGDQRDSKIMERPKMNLNAKYDKVEEEKKLKDLLRDDFIDDLKTGHLVPIQLPMINTGKVFKDESKNDSKSDNNITDNKLRTTTGKIKKKNIILDSDDDEDFVDGIIAEEDISSKVHSVLAKKLVKVEKSISRNFFFIFSIF